MLKQNIVCILSIAISASAFGAKEPTRLDDLVRKSPLIFEGEVVKIEYRNSASNQQHPLGLPHTFVTYRVINPIFGKTEGLFTLRVFGGAYSDGRVLEASHYPNFDLGEHDILLVNGNTELGCPLMSCTEGRFRISGNKIFTDAGRVIRKGKEKSFFAYGSFQPLAEVNTRTIMHPKTGEKAILTIKGDEIKPPPPEADQLNVSEFISLLRKLKQGQQPTTVPSADIRKEIKAISFQAMPAPVAPPSKIIPPKDQEEMTEQKLLEANGGNPVLKP